MIRLLLLTFGPLFAPLAGWYLWQVFGVKPKIDPVTGDQIPPDFQKAPKAKLAVAGVVLMFLTVGGFLLVHHLSAEDPYRPLTLDEMQKILTPPDETADPQR